MKLLKRLIASGLCILALSGCLSQARLESQRTALENANRKYDAALLGADARALGELYADDFRYFGPNDVVRNKSSQIAALTSGAVDLIDGRSSDVDIRIYGTTAVVTGKFAGRVRVSGREFAFNEPYSTVWVRQRGEWRLVLEHGSVVEDQG